MDITLIPLDDIDATALVRDRAKLDDGELWELRSSIAAHGLRMPVEVFPIEGAKPWGLISGYRRLAAFREMREFNRDRFAAIPAFVREPANLTEAIVAMVEENAIRSEVSPWEQAMVAVSAWHREIFELDRRGRRRPFTRASAASGSTACARSRSSPTSSKAS